MLQAEALMLEQILYQVCRSAVHVQWDNINAISKGLDKQHRLIGKVSWYSISNSSDYFSRCQIYFPVLSTLLTDESTMAALGSSFCFTPLVSESVLPSQMVDISIPAFDHPTLRLT